MRQNYDDIETPAGATLTDQEIRKLVERGEVNREDLTMKERELYREELKKARR